MTTDFHTHAFPDDLAPNAISTLNAAVPERARAVLDGTVGALLRSMDRAGIERSVLCSIATAPKQVDAILEWSLSIRDERIVPFASVHPDCDDLPGEVRKIAESGLRGIKMHPLYQGFATDERRMWPFYEAVAEAGLILVMHSGCDIASPRDDDRASPRRLFEVHIAFPEIPIVAAHLGGWQKWEEVLEALAGTDVYLETSYTFGVGPPELVESILRRHAADRILFGSDSPWRDQKGALHITRFAIPDRRLRQKVLQGNADRLLGPAAGPHRSR